MVLDFDFRLNSLREHCSNHRNKAVQTKTHLNVPMFSPPHILRQIPRRIKSTKRKRRIKKKNVKKGIEVKKDTNPLIGKPKF